MTRSRNKKLTGVSSSSKDPVNDDEIVQMRGRDSKRAPACSRQPTPCGSGGQAHSTFENSGNSSRNLQKPTNRYGDASLPLNRNARMECKKAESDVYACNSASVAGSSRLLSFKYANPSSEKELKARLVWLREHIAQEQDLVEMHRLNQEIVTVLSQLEAAMSQDEHKNTKVFGTKRKFTPEPEISEVLTGGGLLMKAKAPQQSKTTLAGHSASEHAQTTAVAASAHHQAKTAQSRPKTSHSHQVAKLWDQIGEGIEKVRKD
ncbi:MAG: hypothetical protein MMC23_008314 [Stictis urceolatum]|nr:hypothetical protein [Stictis urceolata]